MQALVLAAGYATRLYPLTKDFPKPLLKVRGRHIIDYIIDKLNDLAEIEKIIVITNSRFFRHFQRWKKTLDTKVPIRLVDDLTKSLADRRGAIGDLAFAIDRLKIKDDLLVIGGDNLFDADLEQFLEFALKKKKDPVIGVYRLKNKAEAKKYGVVSLNSKLQIVDFAEKPKKPRSKMVAMCLYYFPRARLALIKRYLSKIDNKHDATGFYIDWLRKNYKVYGYVFTGHWYDIGDYRFYRKANTEFK